MRALLTSLSAVVALAASSPLCADTAESALSAGRRVRAEYAPPENGWPLNRQFSLPVRLVATSPGGRLPADLKVDVDLVMPAHRHGANIVPSLKQVDGNLYRLHGLLMHMSGEWQIRFTLTSGSYVDQIVIPIHVE